MKVLSDIAVPPQESCYSADLSLLEFCSSATLNLILRGSCLDDLKHEHEDAIDWKVLALKDSDQTTSLW